MNSPTEHFASTSLIGLSDKQRGPRKWIWTVVSDTIPKRIPNTIHEKKKNKLLITTFYIVSRVECTINNKRKIVNDIRYRMESVIFLSFSPLPVVLLFLILKGSNMPFEYICTVIVESCGLARLMSNREDLFFYTSKNMPLPVLEIASPNGADQ